MHLFVVYMCHNPRLERPKQEDSRSAWAKEQDPVSKVSKNKIYTKRVTSISYIVTKL